MMPESSGMTNVLPDVSVCICTFARPVLLRRLLEAVFTQHDTCEVVVVDNDPAASAHAVCDEFLERYPFRFKSIGLPKPNISLARNAAIHAASAPWVALIDDDELPCADWLMHLRTCQLAYDADIVFAPVLAEYADGVAQWLRDGRYFERRRLPNGTPVGETDARSGNALVRKQSLLALCERLAGHGPFDESYGRTGGEDSILFRQLAAQGCRAVWCDEAPVYEWIPLERASAAWLLRRSYRIGQLYIAAEMSQGDAVHRWRRLLWLEGRAFVQAVVALTLSAVLVPFARVRAFSWLRIAVAQLGKLSYPFMRVRQAYGGDAQ